MPPLRDGREYSAPSFADLAASLQGVDDDLRRQQRCDEILARAAVGIASGASCQSFIPQTLAGICEVIDGCAVAIVLPGTRPIVARLGPPPNALETRMLDEALELPDASAIAVPPQRPSDTGFAIVHVPIVMRDQRVGTLSSLRLRPEAFIGVEREALARLANLLALAWGAERYQQQRARLARLEERQRIADELHDDVAQLVFGAQMSLDRLLEHDDLEDSVIDAAERARNLIARVDGTIRSVIHQLDREPAVDLPDRLAGVVAEIEREFQVAVHLEVTASAADASKHIRRSAEDALVKVARESLVNAAKHAGPCRATATLDAAADQLRLTVVDDGIAATPNGGGRRHGIASLRRAVAEQGGSLSIVKGAAGGMSVTAVLPR